MSRFAKAPPVGALGVGFTGVTGAELPLSAPVPPLLPLGTQLGSKLEPPELGAVPGFTVEPPLGALLDVWPPPADVEPPLPAVTPPPVEPPWLPPLGDVEVPAETPPDGDAEAGRANASMATTAASAVDRAKRTPYVFGSFDES
jgi:hypothetical protein